jgi:hypothetical protein
MLLIFGKTLVYLLAAHFLADFPLQAEFLSKGKNWKSNPYAAWMPWQCCMFAHVMIHAGFVQFITGSFWLGIAEGVIHGATDCAKCAGWIDGKQDQALHVCCKVLWTLLAVFIHIQ